MMGPGGGTHCPASANHCARPLGQGAGIRGWENGPEEPEPMGHRGPARDPETETGTLKLRNPEDEGPGNHPTPHTSQSGAEEIQETESRAQP